MKSYFLFGEIMDIQKIKELIDKVSVIPKQEEYYVVGTKEYLDVIEPYKPKNMKRMVVPDEYNFGGIYNEKIYIIPITETQPLKFMVDT